MATQLPADRARELTETFAQQGWLDLGQVLRGDELQRWTASFDADWAKWGRGGIALGPAVWASDDGRQWMNQDSLVTSPEFDGLVRHPEILPIVELLQGDDTCFEDITIRYMPASRDEEEQQHWHRDTGTDAGHPLALRSLQAMVYLSDVSPGTHCFSISPESVADLREPRATGEQLEHSPGLDLHGAAGSVFLFNSSALHAAHVRPRGGERKSVQIYYRRLSHAGGPIAAATVVPSSLTHHPDTAVRRFYGESINERTRVFLDAFAPSAKI